MRTCPDGEARIARYLSLAGEGVKLNEYLGGGADGDVWKTSRGTAIKVLSHENTYFNERDTYKRLAFWGITEQIDGFWVPKMLGYDDELRVIEMDIVQHPPYIIDFAKVMLDRPPDFSADELDQRDEDGRERFEHNWPRVLSLLPALESYQIYYLDPKRGNIAFPDVP